MKRLILVVLIAGCAQQPRQPTEAQRALIAYYADLCRRQGVNVDNDQVLRGCIAASYRRDVQAGYFSNRTGEVLQGLGSVYGVTGNSQTCSTRPDYSGGWITTCR